MLLRSSSTPVLGSLLPCFPDIPNNSSNHSDATIKHPPTTSIHQTHSKLSLHQTGSFNLSSISCNSSPISPAINDGNRGFRRAQSEGNLEGLAHSCCNKNDKPCTPNLPKKSRRPSCSMLQTIPSFSFYNMSGKYNEEDIEKEEEERGELEENEGDDFSSTNMIMMGLVKENGSTNESRNTAFEEESKAYLATGLGASGGDLGGGSRGGGGRGGDFTPGRYSGDSGDRPGVEEYYKRMVEENPSNPIFLRNYAQFLQQSKQDLQGAEEYLSRAIMVDPKDGEILCQYAKVVWELHRDQDRASGYFERAVQAAPQDCYVHAAYASFLWETEEDEDEDQTCCVHAMPPVLLEGGGMASAVST